MFGAELYFVHNGPLADLVTVCAGSDIMHPFGVLITGGIAGGLFATMFTLTQNKWKIDDVLGVCPLHGLCGGIAAGIFGQVAIDGLGGVSLSTQLIGTALGIAGGFFIYCLLKYLMGLCLSQEEEYNGADLSIHKISATPAND